MLVPFSPAFLAGEPRAEAFLAGDFRHQERRGARVVRAAERRTSAQTIGALRAQVGLHASAAQLASLTALEQPGTVVAVTGQQVGLFLGPLYAVYKAASAIAVARTLEAETERRCVPVFWLQTEDHDIEEINHCFVLADGLHRFELATKNDRRSISTLTLGDAVTGQLDALAAVLADQPHVAEVMKLLRAYYRPDVTWGQAFAGVISTLFADHGLLVLDPRAPALTAQLAPVHAHAIREASALSRVLLDRTAQLEAAGFAAQVHVRENAPLSFFHAEGPDGPRARLEPGAAVLDMIERSPSSFSTSALLRPIAQDTLLPTAAIIGGPGELNYYAQMQPLYDAFSLPMPMVVPRARFRVVTARTRALLDRLGLTAAEVEAPTDALLARLTPKTEFSPELFARQLHAAIAPVLSALPTTDADVVDALKRTQGTVTRAFSRLSARYARSLRNADETLLSRVERVQTALFPHGEPQERVLSLATFASRFGLSDFITMVFEGLAPFGTSVAELTP